MTSNSKSLAPFFLLSLLLHSCLFFAWPRTAEIARPPYPIAVSFLPAPEPLGQKETVPAKRAETARRATSSTATKRAARADARPPPPQAEIEEPLESMSQRPPADTRAADLRSPRALPSLRQLLPPVTWSPPRQGAAEEAPVRLDTREPRYVSYFESIKRAIERVWEYPPAALQGGLEGKLVLEFSVLEDGALVGPRLVRSSGFVELDDEAMRAVRAAAPFRPIPPSIGRARIDILASFEYYDNRLQYHFTP
ncbi:MAG TPA: TonB family protein [Candidatus Acidoferrales bacterium]|nr:TonB family protein [Candidatus Acidoferrales bacterium]